MKKNIRIGTRDSQLAVWQATLVQEELKQNGIAAELVYIKSDGDIDLVTPLYEMGVQGVFTKALDAALLSDRIDIAVHSMKDVPTQLAKGLAQAAVLPRASYKDLLVFKGDEKNIFSELGFSNGEWSASHPFSKQSSSFTVASSSVRRRAQWLNRYPHHNTDNLRGNVNTRLQKLQNNNWNGAIFAAAGLERIGLRPANSIELDWMLPAPTQGAIMIACRENDKDSMDACAPLNDIATALCTAIEKDFLRVLMGGCTTPISALAQLKNNTVVFNGNILSPDGQEKIEISLEAPVDGSGALGTRAAQQVLEKGGRNIITSIRNAGS
ncbi:MAG: hydroxymethylbilane synthase [Chitinophagaceae bacterium]|nr:hydroxymethylbilane synthase [Chitinophagaceae bacterium]